MVTIDRVTKNGCLVVHITGEDEKMLSDLHLIYNRNSGEVLHNLIQWNYNLMTGKMED